MREEEQKEKLEELEDKLEKALERIEELEDELSVEEEASQQDSIHIESAEGSPFRVHWVQPGETGSSCSDIDTVKKAQEAFAAANAARNADGHRVMHGDVLVLMCNYESGDACYYVGLCVVTNTPNQLSVPGGPDITEDSGNKEFMAWYTCPGENTGNCDCDYGQSIPELTSEGDWDDWHVSLGSCIRFTDLTNLEVYQSDEEGTDLKAYTREITLNKCGEIISISQESETTISIPCCTDDDDYDDDPEDPHCSDNSPEGNWANWPEFIAVDRRMDRDISEDNPEGIRTTIMSKSADCRYIRVSGTGVNGWWEWNKAQDNLWKPSDIGGYSNATLMGLYSKAGSTTTYTVRAHP